MSEKVRKKRASKYATPEDAREAVRVRNRLASKKRKAARAIAEGRVPGCVGGQQKYWTDEERKIARRAAVARWRAANIETARESDAKLKRRLRREKAAAEGRVLQKVGGDPRLTPAQRRANALANSQAYRRKYPERSKQKEQEYYRNNKDAAKARARTRRARKRNALGTHTVADIRYLWKLQKGKCVFCLNRLYEGKFHIDHHVPLIGGGTNDRSNLRLLHKKCNLAKGARDPLDHAQRNGMLCW